MKNAVHSLAILSRSVGIEDHGFLGLPAYLMRACSELWGIDRGLATVYFLEQNPSASVNVLSEALEFPSQTKILALQAIQFLAVLYKFYASCCVGNKNIF